MNLILFEHDETTRPLPKSDPRAVHLLDVLRRHEGDTFDAGLINGPRGKATLAAITPDALALTFTWGEPPPPPDQITLIIGLPRPQSARKILQEATALGVAALHFVHTEKSDPNYADSTLWTSGEWRRHLLTGAEQAFDTRLPKVTWGHPLSSVLPSSGHRLALDNYEATVPLQNCNLMGNVGPKLVDQLSLAIGPERGWGTTDRETLRTAGFTLSHLGSRVLRTETALVAAVAIAKSIRGSW